MSPRHARVSAHVCLAAAQTSPQLALAELFAYVDLLQNETVTAALLSSVSPFCPANEDTSNWEFPDVCRYYLGKFGQWSSLLFSMVSLVGAMVIYWVLMSNFLYNSGLFIYSKSVFLLLNPGGVGGQGSRGGGDGRWLIFTLTCESLRLQITLTTSTCPIPPLEPTGLIEVDHLAPCVCVCVCVGVGGAGGGTVPVCHAASRPLACYSVQQVHS